MKVYFPDPDPACKPIVSCFISDGVGEWGNMYSWYDISS
jgi:hypothetical protein